MDSLKNLFFDLRLIRILLLVLSLVSFNLIYAQVHIDSFTELPSELENNLPGLQKTFYLISAEDNDKNAGYLVFTIDKDVFSSAIQAYLRSEMRSYEQQNDVFNSDCRFGIRHLINFIPSDENTVENNLQCDKLINSYIYHLRGQEENLKWEWRGVSSGLHWIAEAQTELLNVTVKYQLSIAIQPNAQKLSFKYNGDGHLSIVYKGCWPLFNDIFSNTTPRDMTISVKESVKEVNYSAIKSDELKAYLNMSDEIGLKTDDQLIYVYLALKTP